jgi:DNA-binding winged helix-turn-helix (wHTH) protein/Tol biopolymer transport system component
MRAGLELLIHFGDFTLDRERHGLYRGQQRVRLTPKPLETLIFLVENRGRTIEKKELLDAVWKGTFVTEDTLVHAIGEIRRALEDDKDNPRFIQTIPRQGYRFVGEVVTERGAQELQGVEYALFGGEGRASAGMPQPPTRKKKAPRWLWVVIFTLIVVALIPGWVLLSLRRSEPEMPSKLPVLTQLTSEPTGAYKPAFSPEGNILYLSNGAINIQLVRNEGRLRITEEINPSGDIPVFTPRGGQVVFSIPRSGEAGSRVFDLFKVDSIGGPPKLFVPGASGAGFSPDENWVAYTKHHSSRKALWASPVDRLQDYVEVADKGFVPRWSPDGKWLAYTTADPNQDDGYIWLVSPSFSESGRLTISGRRRLTQKRQTMYGLSWTPDSRSIIFAGNLTGQMHLYRLSISDGSLTPLTAGRGDYFSPWVSPDGKTLIFSHANLVRNLMIADKIEGSEGQALTEDEYHLWPRLSPSGRLVASVVRRGGLFSHLYVTDIGTRKRTRLSDQPARHPSWIDEENLAYLQDSPSGFTEVVVANITSGVKGAWTRFIGDANWVAVHRDKKRIAVVLKSGDGAQKILLRDRERPENDQIIAQGAEYEELRWLPGGLALTWSGLERSSDSTSNGVWVWKPDESGPQRVIEEGYGPSWSADGKNIYFSRIRDYAGLWRFDLRQRTPTKVRSWNYLSDYHYDIVGERLVFTQAGGRSQIYSMSLDQ